MKLKHACQVMNQRLGSQSLSHTETECLTGKSNVFMVTGTVQRYIPLWLPGVLVPVKCMFV